MENIQRKAVVTVAAVLMAFTAFSGPSMAAKSAPSTQPTILNETALTLACIHVGGGIYVCKAL
jgi:hypothetical protein